MPHSKEDIIRFVQSDFREMPGLRLTEAQARRLWNLDRATCQDVLDTLVARSILARGADGRYRSTSEEHEQPRGAPGYTPHAAA